MRKTTKSQIHKLLMTICLVAALSACATPIRKMQISHEFSENIKFSQLRVAILPLEGKQEGAKFFRKALHVNFVNAGFNVVERFAVDAALKKNGWKKPDRFLEIAPQKIGEALGADALLYANVTKWSRIYAIIHSTLTVGLELKLVDARTGELLWTGEQLDRVNEGLLNIPVRVISAIVGPRFLAGNEDNLNQLANKIAKNITEPLRKSFEIKEEDKMDRKIVIASAKEYIKKIENNSKNESNLVKYVFVDNESLNPTDSLSSKSDNKPPARKSIQSTSKQSTNKHKRISRSDNYYEHEKSDYTIQVGAFKDQNNADELFEKLKQKGYEVFVALAKTGKKILYKVQVDHFKSKKEATQFAKKLHQKENLSYFVTRTSAASPA